MNKIVYKAVSLEEFAAMVPAAADFIVIGQRQSGRSTVADLINQILRNNGDDSNVVNHDCVWTRGVGAEPKPCRDIGTRVFYYRDQKYLGTTGGYKSETSEHVKNVIQVWPGAENQVAWIGAEKLPAIWAVKLELPLGELVWLLKTLNEHKEWVMTAFIDDDSEPYSPPVIRDVSLHLPKLLHWVCRFEVALEGEAIPKSLYSVSEEALMKAFVETKVGGLLTLHHAMARSFVGDHPVVELQIESPLTQNYVPVVVRGDWDVSAIVSRIAKGQ